MALRIRKTVKIAPGIKLNVSKSGVSTSVGGKGLTANFGKKGTRLTAGLPGTGVSTSKLYKKEAGGASDAGNASSPFGGASAATNLFAAAFVIIGTAVVLYVIM